MTDEPVVTFVEMAPDEVVAWLPGALERFVEKRIDAGESPERANSTVVAQREASFPGGMAAPGHHVLHVLANGERHGALWLCPGFAAETHERFVFFVELNAEHRDTAMLRATIRAAEQWAVADGATRLSVSVLGPNEDAQAAYEHMGYMVAATAMFKPLE